MERPFVRATMLANGRDDEPIDPPAREIRLNLNTVRYLSFVAGVTEVLFDDGDYIIVEEAPLTLLTQEPLPAVWA